MPQTTKSQIGVIGLATMGANLARNLASKGFITSVFNRTYAKTEQLLELVDQITANSDPAKDVEVLQNHGKLIGCQNLDEFIDSLESPRKIILMVKSGQAVDDFLETLKPLLNPEDIVIDGGNSNWKDTLRRQEKLSKQDSNKKNLIFDFGGVLFEPQYLTVNKFFEKRGLVDGKDYDGQKLWEEIKTELPCKDDISFRQFWDAFWLKYTLRLGFDNQTGLELIEYLNKEWHHQIFPQTVEVIKKYKLAGFKIYYLTNTFSEIFSKRQQTEIFGYFDGGLSDLELDFAFSKPQAEIYQKLMHKFDLKIEECIFIDDLQENIEGAAKLGLATIWFQEDTNLDLEIQKLLVKSNFHLISCGVSGGEEGALHGPSIMPSGEPEVVAQLLPILQKIAAKDFSGGFCVTNIGVGPSGHFVKMVHNGIEYAFMQGIAEIYDILRYNSYSDDQIREVFVELNQGELKSFLLDITIKILESKDSLGEGFLLDKIQDQAGAKGTGSWTVEAALELGVATPTIAAAVFARTMSARNQSFNCQKKEIKSTMIRDLSGKSYPINISWLKKVLELVFLVSYLQGLDLIIHADNFYKWRVDISEVCRIWQGGCIIRSQMLWDLAQYFFSEKNLTKEILEFESGYNILPIIDIDLQSKTPTPVLNSVSDYILSITNKNLPTNLIQAQRDYFGAHTYQRTDQDGIFTGGWEK